MKKLLTILILLLAVASQGWAVDDITTLYPLPHDVGEDWNALQIDYDLVSGIKSGDKITIYINKDDRNHNIQVQYEKPKVSGEGNDWTGIGIDLATETEGEIYSITMTETAAGYFNETTKSKLILTGENYTVTKVTLTHDDTPKQLFPKTVINGWGNISISKDLFTNAVVNDIVKAEFNESVSSAELKFLYGWGSGEEYTITTDETSKIVSLKIASEEIFDKLTKKGLLISPRSDNSVSIKDVKIVPTYKLSVTTENGKLYLGDTETEYTNNTRYESGSTVTLRAVANEGYRFVNWKNGDDIVSETASYTTPALSADLTLTANFIQQFTVTAASADTNKGTVAITDADANNKYDAGSTVTVTATAASASYEFDKWTKTGDDTWNTSEAASTNPLSISELAADWTLTASFKDKTKDTPEISLSSFSAGDGATLAAGVFTTTANEKTISQWIGDNSGVTGNKLVVKFAGAPTGEEGQSVKVAAQYIAAEYEEANAYPDENNIAVVNLNNTKYIKSIYIQLAKPGSVTVNSVALDPLYTVTATSANNGQGSAVVSTDPTSDGKYAYGTEVTVTATPESGYSFSQWKVNDTSVSTNASYTFIATEDVALTATFAETAPITYPITVWEGSAAVSWNDPKIQPSISADKFANLALNDVIKVYVTDAENATINIMANEGWVKLSDTDSYQVTTEAILTKIKNQGIALTGVNYTLTAVKIEKPKYQLTIVSNGGNVTVKKGTETDPTADREFEAGTALTLTATPASSIYTFSKWQKGGEDIDGGTSNPLVTTMDGADMTISAVFTTSVPPQDLGAASTEIKAKTDTQDEQGIVIPCWRFKNAYVGDIITINMTVAEPGTITLKQSDNGWGDLDNSVATGVALNTSTPSFTYALTETSLPLVKANGLYVMGDKFTCTSVTLISAGTVPTSDARTNKYIYNVSKTITTEATATIAKEIFTKASIGDKLTLTISSVDNTDGAMITLKSGEETIKSESGIKNTTSYSYPLQNADITKVKANGLTIAGSGFTLDKVHLLTEGDVAEVSDPVLDFSLDNFEADEGNTYDKTNHILTNSNGWSGMTLTIGSGSTYSGSSLEVRTKEASKLKITVKYVGEGEVELSESGDPSRRHVVSGLANTKKINQVIIQNQESGTLHFTYMALDPATQYELSVTSEDGSVTVKNGEEATEEAFFNANTTLSLEPVAATNFEFEKWTIGGASSTDNPLSLTMDGDKVVTAHFKPKGLAENETRNLHTSSGDVIDWNQICEKGASYGALLQAGDVFQITVSALTSGTDDHQVVLRGGSHDEGTSVKATGMVEIVVTADILSNYTSGFSITGTGVTISKVDLFRPKAVSRTERMMNESEVVMDGSNGATVNSGRFANASAYDVLRVYFTNTSGATSTSAEEDKMHLILKYNGESDNWDYIKEMRFAGSETQFEIPLTQSVLALLKNNGLQVTGEKFTLKSVSLFTASALGPDTKKNSDEEKKDDEKKGDEEAIIDEKTGEADLTVLAPQDDTKTTLTENEDGSITMTTTEPYCAAQIWFSDPEPVAGNVLKVELAESNVNVTVTVKYTDGTESQMSANTMVANARAMTRAVASARAATRGDSDSGTTVEVPLETGKEVQNIEVKNNVAGTITIKKMQVTTINVFTNGEANLSMLKPQSNATYDTAAHTLATTKGWTGATISPVAGENVSGKELLIEFADASKVKVAVKYRTDVEGPSTIMEKAAKAVRLALDNTKNIQEISIQPTEASIVTFTKIAVNSEESDDGTLKPGKTITLWESAAGETLAWNEVANQDASVGEILQEYDELLITISGVTEGCDWPKVFIRDASSEQAGNEVLLNDIGSFPYTVRIVLTGEMAQQLQEGFSICGDGVTVTKLQVYRPEAPKEGDIHLADLNYGYNSSYDKGTHTITTTARWAARGWEIGDKRYNDKNLITVKFEPVDFPVTLKMEYTTGIQTAQATSVGVPAGRTELLLEIPKGISKLNRVYIIYENPGSVKLTEASVTYQDKLKLSTAIEAFEAEGVIHDGRYDTDGWYNLRGMRIAEPKTSGIYIHGGKKVVIY